MSRLALSLGLKTLAAASVSMAGVAFIAWLGLAGMLPMILLGGAVCWWAGR
jgi:hypothetical protein